VLTGDVTPNFALGGPADPDESHPDIDWTAHLRAAKLDVPRPRRLTRLMDQGDAPETSSRAELVHQ
jgi:hypothetical protein